MKPFNIKLSADHRAKLEAYRAANGLRSEADAVRRLIEGAATSHLLINRGSLEEPALEGFDRMAAAKEAVAIVGALSLEERTMAPRPFVNRAKGSWKAP